MSSSYAPLALIVVTIALAAYIATSGGPDRQQGERSAGQSTGQAAQETVDQTEASSASQTAAAPAAQSAADMGGPATAGGSPATSLSPGGAQSGPAPLSSQGVPMHSRYPGPLPPGEGLAQGQDSRPFARDSGRDTGAASANTAPDQPQMSMSAAIEKSMADDSEKAQAPQQPAQASGSQASGAEAADSQAGNDQEGSVQAVWEELKEAGRETADLFTGDDSGQQSGSDHQGALGDIWEELKEAGHQTAQIFVGSKAGDGSGTQHGDGASASTGQGSGQGQGTQRDVKVYTTQGQELGAISAIVIDRTSNNVHAVVIGQAEPGSSNRVDQKLRAALCNDGAQ